MKVLVAIFLIVVAGAAAAGSDPFWMSVLTTQIGEADHEVGLEDAKDIPDLAADLGLKLLVKFVEKANLTGALKGDGPFTVFGPTDEAFMRLPKDLVEFLLKNTTLLAELLKYHVLPVKAESGSLSNDELAGSLEGKDVRINIYEKTRWNKTETVITASGSRVLKADQEASNGVIHVVDRVLFPPPGSIADVVSKAKPLSILLKGLNLTNLLNSLAGDGPFTLFAPSDKAIGRIPKKCLVRLFNDTAKLKEVLEYHVAPGTYYSAGLSCGEALKTLQGSNVTVRVHHGRIAVNRAGVVFPDVTVTNGVIHVIDRLLFPDDDGIDRYCDDAIDRAEKINDQREAMEALRLFDLFN